MEDYPQGHRDIQSDSLIEYGNGIDTPSGDHFDRCQVDVNTIKVISWLSLDTGRVMWIVRDACLLRSNRINYSHLTIVCIDSLSVLRDHPTQAGSTQHIGFAKDSLL